MKLWRKPFDCNGKAAASAKVQIDKERCKGCGYCVEFCPRKALIMSLEIGPKGYHPAEVVDDSKCLDCRFCESICPEFGIKLSTDKEIADTDAKTTKAPVK
jgi:2-oxoglutarate ferredoxin oxidoreductase subunit delta